MHLPTDEEDCERSESDYKECNSPISSHNRCAPSHCTLSRLFPFSPSLSINSRMRGNTSGGAVKNDQSSVKLSR